MKIYYNSWLAKVLTFIGGFATMMFFGVVITEHSSLRSRTQKHEWCHVKQYWDCVMLGAELSALLLIWLFAFNVRTWWLLTLIILPFIFYYLVYLVEWVYWIIRVGVKRAYRKIGFERQAYWVDRTWDKPKNLQNQYEIFGWWKKLD